MGPSTPEEALLGKVAFWIPLFLLVSWPQTVRSHSFTAWPQSVRTRIRAGSRHFCKNTTIEKQTKTKTSCSFPQLPIRSISYSLLGRADFRQTATNRLPGSSLTKELITRQLKPSCLSRLTSHFTITIPNNFTLNLNL